MTKSDKNRPLTQRQLNAIELIICGKLDAEVADEVGVTRQTVNQWRNRNPFFVAEMNFRRQNVWESQVERLRNLVSRAVGVLEEELQGDNELNETND